MSFVNIGLGIGALGTGFKIFKGAKQDSLANSIEVPDADYTTSPYAKAILENAKRLAGAPMPGMDQAERSIYGAHANTLAGVNRNATSGAQALAMLAATQGQTNAAFSGLRDQQNNFFLQMMQNLNNANRGMIQEGDKEYQSDLRNKELAMSEKNALRNASTQNIGSGLNDLTNYAFLAHMIKKDE